MGFCCSKSIKIASTSKKDDQITLPMTTLMPYSSQASLRIAPNHIKTRSSSPPKTLTKFDLPTPQGTKTCNTISPISVKKTQNLFEVAKSKPISSQTMKSVSTIDLDLIKKAKRFSLIISKNPNTDLDLSDNSESDEISIGSESPNTPLKFPNHCNTQTEMPKNISFKSLKTMNDVIHTQSLTKQRSLEGQKKINQYTFKGLLGTGAFGKVYKVIDDQGNPAAVKVYNKKTLRNRWIGKKRTAWDLIQSEIQIMSSLNHKGIIRLLEVIDFKESKKIYLVLEYIEKGSIFDKCPMTEKEAKNYFYDLVLAIEYLHNTAYVVHRDIKPQNLLITKDNHIKICDFGSAQFIDNLRDELNNSAGTYLFMPPEAHKAKGFRGKPADIWALGITLYYMIAGRTPFNSRNISSLCDEISQEEIMFTQNFSDKVKSLIRGMTDKDPEKRYSIDAVKEHLWFKDVIL
ncbi:hypothetical protein SteCoe_1951 [Stentor coeruleus]|uniref:Protein kinase domain-containing protein n=1 Tax=Stentor coeruleus TaxID=5963 RepID=A0A1R2D0J9_9CILI|nr:hypothetical protein SteCoe_1951 [Stentor coeruleus]